MFQLKVEIKFNLKGSAATMTITFNLSNLSDLCTVTGAISDRVVVNGGLGDDRIIDNHTGAKSSILHGNAGNDWITGGSYTSKIAGGPGDDFITLKGSPDSVSGGAGYDTVQLNTELYDALGDQGIVWLGSGNLSQLLTEAGLTLDPAHFLSLGTSGDVERVQTSIFGEGSGRGGLDILGDNTANMLRGGAAANILHGAGGDDVLYGFSGDDRLFGGQGDDSLNGASGRDVLFGGGGKDVLDLDAGDTATGGAGSDRFSATFGSFTITDFVQGQDQIVLSGATNVWASDASHLLFQASGNTYQISLGGNVDALGLIIGANAGSDILV